MNIAEKQWNVSFRSSDKDITLEITEFLINLDKCQFDCATDDYLDDVVHLNITGTSFKVLSDLMELIHRLT